MKVIYAFNATMNVFELNVTTLQVGGCSSKCCIRGIDRQYHSGVGGGTLRTARLCIGRAGAAAAAGTHAIRKEVTRGINTAAAADDKLLE